MVETKRVITVAPFPGSNQEGKETLKLGNFKTVGVGTGVTVD